MEQVRTVHGRAWSILGIQKNQAGHTPFPYYAVSAWILTVAAVAVGGQWGDGNGCMKIMGYGHTASLGMRVYIKIRDG
jgi:hypothetical protein